MHNNNAKQRDHAERIPWYSLNPRHIRMRRVLIPVAIFLLLSLCNEKHIWQWAWQSGYHAYFNCRPVVDARGRQIAAWRWVEGREIRLYTSPLIAASRVRFSATDMQELIDELGLRITVQVIPQPERVTRAVLNSTLRKDGKSWVDFARLCRELVASRDGHYAEMVYVPGTIDSEPGVTGAAMFKYGVAILNAQEATSFTARHETAHLLGYHLHDTWPLIVLGYSNPQWAIYHKKNTEFETLMMPSPDGFELSPRSRDALLCFWHGLEQRTGKHFFVKK